jgi:hypothetical protein
MRKQQGTIGSLGTYESIWDGIDDDLEREMISRELRKDYRRPMKAIIRSAKINYWKQIGIWTLSDITRYVPIIGGMMLLVLLILIASY